MLISNAMPSERTTSPLKSASSSSCHRETRVTSHGVNYTQNPQPLSATQLETLQLASVPTTYYLVARCVPRTWKKFGTLGQLSHESPTPVGYHMKCIQLEPDTESPSRCRVERLEPEISCMAG
jgi:hypothetical protein